MYEKRIGIEKSLWMENVNMYFSQISLYTCIYDRNNI